jgi:hypothetical protein
MISRVGSLFFVLGVSVVACAPEPVAPPPAAPTAPPPDASAAPNAAPAAAEAAAASGYDKLRRRGLPDLGGEDDARDVPSCASRRRHENGKVSTHWRRA